MTLPPPPPRHDARNRRVSPRIACCLLAAALLLLMTGRPATAPAATGLPFQVGEKLTFEVRWCFIPVGEATLTVLAAQGPEQGGFQFLMLAHTAPYLDPFYRVRERIEAFTDPGLNRSLLYRETREGSSPKQVAIQFDWARGEAAYDDTHAIRRIAVPPGTFDPLTVFYAFRCQVLEVGREYHLPVTDGKKLVMGRAQVLQREVLTLRGQDFDTFVVQPDLAEIGGVYEKSPDASLKIWVTADDRRIPLRIESAVKIGSFVAELVATENVAGVQIPPRTRP